MKINKGTVEAFDPGTGLGIIRDDANGARVSFLIIHAHRPTHNAWEDNPQPYFGVAHNQTAAGTQFRAEVVSEMPVVYTVGDHGVSAWAPAKLWEAELRRIKNPPTLRVVVLKNSDVDHIPYDPRGSDGQRHLREISLQFPRTGSENDQLTANYGRHRAAADITNGIVVQKAPEATNGRRSSQWHSIRDPRAPFEQIPADHWGLTCHVGRQ